MNVNAMYKGERVIAAQQEVDDMTLESDRQREIGIENTQLMRRLARAMKQDAYDPAKASKYRDMAQASCEASRRKARHALSAQNAKLARALVSQKPFYSTDAMREEESARQAVLTSMSRAQRRRKNVRAIDGLCRSQAVLRKNVRAIDGLYRSQVQLLGLEPGKASSAVERHPQQLPLDYGESLTRELEGGILFSGGGGVQADFKLRTARQMREEVAKAQSRSQSGGASGGSQQGSSAVRRHSTGGGQQAFRQLCSGFSGGASAQRTAFEDPSAAR
ncbi:hypothetical protein JKP88DRAFT_287654 [Tribonema minus]|uniref:Uncharacterized protein n=1 Tax=Tribonema minus TaxID=303371 RepID=A0A835Z9M3_9STRA|nr:hypothetical protein JKP88DRAFT_287654 [Tribonema minus]